MNTKFSLTNYLREMDVNNPLILETSSTMGYRNVQIITFDEDGGAIEITLALQDYRYTQKDHLPEHLKNLKDEI